MLEMMSQRTGKTVDELRCKGCRENKGCTVFDNCKTLDCLNQKGHEYCYECKDFPCENLMPASDMADKLPHNMKVFNLCFIKQNGEEAFLKKAPEIREAYFKGKMFLGSGPKIV